MTTIGIATLRLTTLKAELFLERDEHPRIALCSVGREVPDQSEIDVSLHARVIDDQTTQASRDAVSETPDRLTPDVRLAASGPLEALAEQSPLCIFVRRKNQLRLNACAIGFGRPDTRIHAIAARRSAQGSPCHAFAAALSLGGQRACCASVDIESLCIYPAWPADDLASLNAVGRRNDHRRGDVIASQSIDFNEEVRVRERRLDWLD